MREIKGRIFTQERVNLDDTRFVDCTFMRCTMVYEGKSVEFTGNTIVREGQLTFSGQAGMLMKNLSLINRVFGGFIEQALKADRDKWEAANVNKTMN
jgi:hypothetical protein